jgi:hypothetical protein
LLSSLLNEPIDGQGVFWSSAGVKSYPIALRALEFEYMHQVLDPDYSSDAIETYAALLRQESLQATIRTVLSTASPNGSEEGDRAAAPMDEPATDPLELLEWRAIDRVSNDQMIMRRLENGGVAWGAL